ncbi:MAG: hypothetical protein QXX35_00685 [Desulfurococcaceae archaeon]
MINVGVIGFGNVGRSLVLELAGLNNVDLKIVLSSTGYVIIDEKNTLRELVDLANVGLKLFNHRKFIESKNSVEVFVEKDVEIAFITLPPSYLNGEPNRSNYYRVLENNISIITCDKTVLSIEFDKLMKEIRRRNLFIGYRATVTAGTPTIELARALRRRNVEKVKGVLNTTTNYIITLVEKGYSYKQAVERAVKDKFAEPEPWINTHGWDSSAKLAIISSTLGYSVSLYEIEKIPLESVSENEIREVLENNQRYRYIAEADYIERKFIVRPVKIDKNDPLTNASPLHNVVEFILENDKIVIQGPAGPAWRTAKVMISELLDYIEYKV